MTQGLEWVAKNHIKPAVVHMSIDGGFSSVVNQAVEQLVKIYHLHVVVSSGGLQVCVLDHRPNVLHFGLKCEHASVPFEQPTCLLAHVAELQGTMAKTPALLHQQVLHLPSQLLLLMTSLHAGRMPTGASSQTFAHVLKIARVFVLPQSQTS